MNSCTMLRSVISKVMARASLLEFVPETAGGSLAGVGEFLATRSATLGHKLVVGGPLVVAVYTVHRKVAARSARRLTRVSTARATIGGNCESTEWTRFGTRTVPVLTEAVITGLVESKLVLGVHGQTALGLFFNFGNWAYGGDCSIFVEERLFAFRIGEELFAKFKVSTSSQSTRVVFVEEFFETNPSTADPYHDGAAQNSDKPQFL